MGFAFMEEPSLKVPSVINTLCFLDLTQQAGAPAVGLLNRLQFLASLLK